MVDAAGLSPNNELTITRDPDVISPALPGDLARFYSERCYLPQSALSRLLEVYEASSDTHTDSPLTKFINTLLRLDQLESLSEGLRPAQHLTRFRSTMIEFQEAEQLEASLASRLNEDTEQRQNLKTAASALAERIAAELAQLDKRLVSLVEKPDQLLVKLGERSYEHEIARLNSLRRDLDALRMQLDSAALSPERAAEAEIEEAFRSAREALAFWRRATGIPLENIIAQVREVIPEIPTTAATDPKYAFDSARAAASAEMKRCSEQLAIDDVTVNKIRELETRVAGARSRLGVLERQVATLSGKASDYARAFVRYFATYATTTVPSVGATMQKSHANR